MGTRADLAAAVSTVDGINGTEYRPTVIKGGAAWPLRGPLERGEATAFAATWYITVILPESERRASEFFDAKHAALADALEEQDMGYVERIEPSTVSTDAGDFDAMLITLRREA